MKNIFAGIFLVAFAVLALVSCDKDFNTIGGNVFGDQNFNLDLYSVQNLRAFSKLTPAVQSNNLPVNSLGILNNPYFGKTTSTLVSQVELTNSTGVVGFGAVVDSVYLYIPYFVDASKTTTVANGDRTFELDSIYGYNENAKFKLEVFQNNYVLNDVSPDPLNPTQKYFNNQRADIDAVKGAKLNTGAISQNDQFTFSNKEIKIYETDGLGVYVDANGDPLPSQTDESIRIVKERKTPGMWLDLDKMFFKQEVIDQPNSIFLNNNVFKNHFRGLYFSVEEIIAGQGSLAMIDLSKAEIKIIYKSAPILGDPKTRKELNLQMGYNLGNKKSNTINFFQYSNDSNYLNEVSNSNETLGDENLFIKGGQGSVSYLKLFGDDLDNNSVADELEDLIANKWLVNQADLIFHINTAAMSGVNQNMEPQRIYIFDATNNRPIADYYSDASTTSNPKNNKVGFNGNIKRDANGKGVTYTFQIYQYIYNLLKSKNPQLNKNILIGIAVTENIDASQNAFLDPSNPIVVDGQSSKFIPVGSVMSPLGTVLYGTAATVPADKRIKVNIYYTKPN